MQLTDAQRSNIHDQILKERSVNRVAKADFRRTVGTRIPRTIHLVRLPAAIITLLPEYRDYDYVVADDDVCIVDPNTYRIVFVVTGSGPRSINAGLHLSTDQIALILRTISVSSTSSLGLGVMTEGQTVPPNFDIQSFPEAVTDRIPEMQNYKYFSADRRVAVVDPQSLKIVLVIGD